MRSGVYPAPGSDKCGAMSELAKTSGDVTKHTLPEKATAGQLADDLIARFPGVDHGHWLREMTARAFTEMRYGNKREERAACDWLNALQRAAIMLKERMEKKEGK